MNLRLRRFGRIALVLASFALSGSAFAQATRTWISGVGDDANPCSRTAPCKTFQGAIAKTAAGGEINIIDVGGFGGVTITKSITIDGLGMTGSILVASTNAIIVNAPGAKVILRNLEINGLGNTGSPGINGIYFLNGSSLTLENVTVYGFATAGVNFAPQSASAELFITDSVIQDNPGTGVLVAPAATFTATGALNNVRLTNNNQGLRVVDGGVVGIINSIVSGNVNAGIVAQSASTLASITATGNLVTGNGNSATSGGVKSSGANAIAVIGGNTIANNFIGLLATGGGQIESYGNNQIHDNGTDGAPTSTILMH